MKKHLFLLLIFIFSSIFAETEVSTGSFLTLSDSKDAPSYLFTNIFGTYIPIEHLTFAEDAEILYGFPNNSGTNFLFTSYNMIRSTSLLEFKKSNYLFGSVTNLYFYPGSDSSKTEINDIAQTGKKNYTIRNEFFGKYRLFKHLILSASTGFDTTSFTAVTPTTKDFDDRNFYIESYASLFLKKWLIAKFEVEHDNDLNSSSKYNLTTIKTGFFGNIFKDSDKRFSYSLFYKGYMNDYFDSKNRIVIYLKGRKHFSTNTDIFAWIYYEAGKSEKLDKFVYINRNLSLLARQKLLSNSLAISLGTTVLFEKDSVNGNFIPLWPFAKVEFEKKHLSAFLYGEVKLPHIYNKNKKQVSSAYQKRVFAGIGYKVWKVKPQLIFLWNKYKKNDAFSGEISQFGIKLQITANM